MMLIQRVMTLFVAMFVSLYWTGCAQAGGKVAGSDHYYVAVLETALKAKSDASLYPKVLDRLGELDRKSKNANTCLVDLLDYSLGAGSGELLVSYITKRGKVMIPLLVNKSKQPHNCLPKYKSICLDKETRDESIADLQDYIEKGVVIEVN